VSPALPWLDLRGRVALVTGAASGIGAAGAVELARRGARLVLADVDEAGLGRAAKACAAAAASDQAAALAIDADVDARDDAVIVRADVSREADCQAMAQAALSRFGRIDVVWANAGMASYGPLAHTDPGAWCRCIDVNVKGVFHTVRAALPEVLRARGQVCLTASVSSFAHPPTMSAYAASKAAVEAMANAWRIELASHGVGLGVVHASWVRTALIDEGELHPGFRMLRDSVPAPMRRVISPEAAARLIVDGIQRRADRIWVPGWVRLLHALRALLHTRAAERDLRRLAPALEAAYLEGVAAAGTLASSYPPRELHRLR
jgi:NAD(P)-dependent dehydrogenase (short-subunit alcohol dehydrogenase family)